MSMARTILVPGTFALSLAAPVMGTVLSKPADAARTLTLTTALATAAGRAQPATPDAAPAQPAQAAIAIVAVEGKVRFRLSTDQPWQKASVGAALTEGTEIETGIRSMVQVRIGQGQTLTIDRATRVAVREAASRTGTDKTTVDLPYGRVKFDVSSATVANDVQINAPDATLAVKGTVGFMDATGGFPTAAFGGEGNTGSFAVTYDETGTTTDVADEQETSTENPDPASLALGTTQLDTGAALARQGDETTVVNRSPGGGTSVSLVTGGGTQVGRSTPPPPPGGDIVFIRDLAKGDFQLVRQNPITNVQTVLRQGAQFNDSFDPFPSLAGLALGTGLTGGQVVLRLEAMSGSWRLLSLPLANPNGVFAEIASNNDSPAVFGLGTIGSRIFAGSEESSQGNNFEVVELGLNGTVTSRMNLPFSVSGRDLAGAPARGSVWLFGSIFGGESAPLFDGAFYEVDPRSNAVISISNPLEFGPSTILGGGITFTDLSTASGVQGLAFVGNRLIVQVQTSGGPAVLVINPTAAGTQSSPTIVAASFQGGILDGLASEPLVTPLGPRSLSNPTGLIDPSLAPLFAATGYANSVAVSPFFHQLVFGQVVATAQDPTACAGFAQPLDLLPFLTAHANQRSGVGQAVNDFRESLTFNHPCLRPGQPGFIPPVVYIDQMFRLLGRDLSDNEFILAPFVAGVTFDPISGGLAMVGNPGNGQRDLFRFEFEEGASGGSATGVLSVLTQNQGGAQFVPVDTFVTSAEILFGLGSIGPSLYTGVFSFAGFGPDFGIAELDVGSSEFSMRMTLPFAEVMGDIAGSNERGSLFVVGETTLDSPMGMLTASAWELDPRNNFVRDAVPLNFSAATVRGPGVPDLSVLEDHDIVVTGSAFTGGRLVLHIIDATTGDRYFVQIDPAAAGTPSNPTIRRVSVNPGFTDALASETAAMPPVPVNLTDPGTPIDMTIGLFADTAFSTVAAGRIPFREMVVSAIVDSSGDPLGCRDVLNPSVIGPFLTPRANQVAGVGRAVSDYRDTLTTGHPCLPGTSPHGIRERLFGRGAATSVQGPPTPLNLPPAPPVAVPPMDTRQLAADFARLARSSAADGPSLVPPQSGTRFGGPTAASRPPKFGSGSSDGPAIGPLPADAKAAKVPLK